MNEMMPLLFAALLVWAGLFSFLMALEARVRALEARLDMRSDSDTFSDEESADADSSSSDNDENKNGGSSSEVV